MNIGPYHFNEFMIQILGFKAIVIAETIARMVF